MYEQDPLAGKKVVGIRRLRTEELERLGWESRGEVTALLFEDGTIVFPSRDSEGNGPGELFGIDAEGDFRLRVPPGQP
jgi:hypothetical protein